MPAEPRQLHFKRQLCVRTGDISEAKAAVLTVKQQLQTSKGELRTVNVGSAKWKQDFDPN
jgi:hypothetical protein